MKPIVTILSLALASTAAADSVRLHEQAGTTGPAVRLMEIAELEGEYAQTLGELVVGRFAEGQDELTVQLATVRRVLSESQVNWSDLSLRGRSVSVVTRLVDEDVLPAPAVVNDRAVVTNNKLAVDQVNAAMTVSGLLIQEIEKLNNATSEELEITFRGDADAAAWLNRSAAVGRYEIESMSRSGLGRVPMKVRRYDAAGTVEEATLTADVSRRVTAVVATKQIRRGEVFSRENTELREVFITSKLGETLDSPNLVLGQRSASALREGSVLLVDHVAPDVLVKRGDLVTVACVSGSLVVRTVGRASEEGAMGDIIAIKNPQTRETVYATVSGKRQTTIKTYDSAQVEKTEEGAW
ncbi:flagellar basal body P-ring formation chaperone FlgA [Algisphaera agarilytica]|uniref:Flagella basal body P-ring formation protein FlgA n=1 Tax=Algisphaera agarilytica TaxID=1385975 RepID=A0A7X0H6W9_9BACT|nr:flagellar basal body P-ring formation chaperone FlgA [Algisphaera agarilytica]MBB6430354.1 flagella basal body P-ring formation protein FlgA [Algisphaera agarilytica]